MFVLFDLLVRKSLGVGAFLVTQIAENGQLLLMRLLDDGRICEAMMKALYSESRPLHFFDGAKSSYVASWQSLESKKATQAGS